MTHFLGGQYFIQIQFKWFEIILKFQFYTNANTFHSLDDAHIILSISTKSGAIDISVNFELIKRYAPEIGTVI